AGPAESGCGEGHAGPGGRLTGGASAVTSAGSALLVIGAVRYSVSVFCALDFLRPRKRGGSSRGAFVISSSRLWIALWLVAAMPTRWPRRISSTAIRAPLHVLPVPGGPWMKR